MAAPVTALGVLSFIFWIHAIARTISPSIEHLA
jgi:hypothetical protein